MSNARNDFLYRLGLIQASLSEASVNDGAPTEVLKNGVASVLRNGLAVLCFTCLESFIKERTAEILNSFDASAVNFSALPKSLQSAVTLGALRGLIFRVKNEPKNSQIQWALNHVTIIASSSTSVANLSPLSFGNEASNIRKEDITGILSAFGVEDGWVNMTQLCKRVGLGGILDCSADFKSIAESRHKAAHSASAHTPIGDLTSHLQSARAIGITFDLLLSEACHRHNKLRHLPTKPITLESQIKLRFLSPHPTLVGHVKEETELIGPPRSLTTYHVHPDLATARTLALPRSATLNEHLVEVDTSAIPIQWTNWK